MEYPMILLADCEGPDQTAHSRSMIWVLAVRMCPESIFSFGGGSNNNKKRIIENRRNK